MLLALKLLLIVAVLIGLLRFKKNLILAISGATVLSVLVFRIPLGKALDASFEIVSASKSLQLFAIVILVIFLGTVQKERAMFDRLIRSLNTIFRDPRVVAMVAPAIIGFMPMPGGALFSAPLVEVTTRKMNLSREFRAFVNYWFRHPWEFVWPIYAGLLLFQTMSDFPLRRIILFQSPFTVIHLAAGSVVALLYFRQQGITNPEKGNTATFRATVRDFAEGIWPILGAVIIFFAFQIPLYLALLVSVTVLCVIKKVTPREIVGILFAPSLLRNLVLLAAVLIFQKIILISHAFTELEGLELTTGLAVLIIFLISFTMGFLTGVNTAYIAIAFPIVLPLIQGLPNFFVLSLYTYVIGFCGVLLSPLHLCLALTNEYFKSSPVKIYRFLLWPVLMLALTATILALTVTF